MPRCDSGGAMNTAASNKQANRGVARSAMPSTVQPQCTPPPATGQAPAQPSPAGAGIGASYTGLRAAAREATEAASRRVERGDERPPPRRAERTRQPRADATPAAAQCPGSSPRPRFCANAASPARATTIPITTADRSTERADDTAGEQTPRPLLANGHAHGVQQRDRRGGAARPP